MNDSVMDLVGIRFCAMAPDRNQSTLGNPFFLGSLALLIVNDQFLKSQYGNTITGKLSDFAGLFVVSFLAVSLARKHQRSERLALIPIAIIFSLAKTIPAITDTIVGGLDLVLPWSNSIVTDPSDLIALTLLLVVPASLRFKPVPLRLWAKNALFLTTVLACTATSQLHPDPVSLGVTENGQVVSVRDSNLFDFSESPTLPDVEARLVATSETVTVSKEAFASREPKDSDCSGNEPKHCFQISSSGTIQETLDGGDNWSTIWKITPDSYATLVGARNEAPNFINPLAPRDLEVTDDDDLIVVVGDSTLVTRSAEGVWTNPDSTFRPLTLPFVIHLFLASIVIYVAIALGLEMFKPRILWLWIPVVAAAVVSLGFGVAVADPGLPMFELLAMLLAGLCGFFAVLAIRHPKVGAGPALAWALIAPPLLALLAAVPALVWKAANLGTFETTAALSALATLAVAAAAYLVTSRIPRTVTPQQSPLLPPVFVPPPTGG